MIRFWNDTFGQVRDPKFAGLTDERKTNFGDDDGFTLGVALGLAFYKDNHKPIFDFIAHAITERVSKDEREQGIYPTDRTDYATVICRYSLGTKF